MREQASSKPALKEQEGIEGGGCMCEKDKREIYVGSESLPLAEWVRSINRNGIRPRRSALVY